MRSWAAVSELDMRVVESPWNEVFPRGATTKSTVDLIQFNSSWIEMKQNSQIKCQGL